MRLSRALRRLLLALLIVLPLLAGCTGMSFVPPNTSNAARRSFSVHADAHPDSGATARAYRIVSGNPAVPATDPRFQRVADYVRAALSSRGLYEAPSGTKVEIEVAITFEMKPSRIETRFTTVTGSENVPESTHKVKETTKLPDGTKQTVEKEVTVPAHTISTQTNNVPYQVTIFPKELRLVATEVPSNPAAGPPRVLWEVTVRNDDEHPEFDGSLPLMVAAAMDYIGVELPEDRLVTMRGDDPRVEFVVAGTDG